MNYDEIVSKINEDYLEGEIEKFLANYNYSDELDKIAKKISDEKNIYCEITDNGNELKVYFPYCMTMTMASISDFVYSLNGTEVIYRFIYTMQEKDSVYDDTFNEFINNILSKGDSWDEDDFDKEFVYFVHYHDNEYHNCCKHIAMHFLTDSEFLQHIYLAITDGVLDNEVFHTKVKIDKCNHSEKVKDLYKCLKATKTFYKLDNSFDYDEYPNIADFVKVLYQKKCFIMNSLAYELNNFEISKDEFSEEISKLSNNSINVRSITDATILIALIKKLKGEQ